MICLTGILIKVKAPDIDPNTGFIYFIDHYLFVGI
ncbi:sodium:solute symporter family protein [Hyalomma marginatum]|uniref:Sodium:solute symporter family protein n=1 Tax=Hyalomma marginatum TaxID=34627 RepID=A0A8S4BTF1_9ACAR|nr:sodium:solute symporter family protein [Hyalomma marginatum]CAG7592866.1 sodium:solute symporter family protein [Hyalomma marginatum]